MNSSNDIIPFVDLWACHQKFLPSFEEAFRDIVRRSAFIRGDELTAFERDFASFHGVPHAIGCASGTDALNLAARALNLKEGDEVITVPNTWISTVFAISHTGARPVLVDVDPHTHQIDVAQVERAITKKTRAVFAVHMYGYPAELTALADLCRTHNIALIEDVAQATNARYDGKICGTVGDIGCFSFFPGKNLGCLGDGGALLTRRDDLAERLRLFADYGQNPRFLHHEIGYNSRLDTIQAAFLSLKLPHLDQATQDRRRLAARYHDLLKDLPVVTPYVGDTRAEPVYHLYVIQVEKDRDACVSYLRERSVMAQIHYPALIPFQPCYAHLGYRRGDFPVAESLIPKILSLPIYPELTDAQQDRVVETLRDFLQR